MARRNRPKSPEAIAAQRLAQRRKDFEALNLPPDAASLPAFADVQVQRAGQKNTGRAWRSNVFRLLLERKTITLDHFMAAEKLATDWAEWKGLAGARDRMGETVDGGRGCAELVTDAMLRAGRRIDAAMSALDATTATTAAAKVLSEFMIATVEEDRAMSWRGIVERCGVPAGKVKLSGVWRDPQIIVVLDGLEALRRHYHEPRRAAA